MDETGNADKIALFFGIFVKLMKNSSIRRFANEIIDLKEQRKISGAGIDYFSRDNRPKMPNVHKFASRVADGASPQALERLWVLRRNTATVSASGCHRALRLAPARRRHVSRIRPGQNQAESRCLPTGSR